MSLGLHIWGEGGEGENEPSRRRTGNTNETSENRPDGDIEACGQGNLNFHQEGPQGVLRLLDDFGHHGHD